MVGNKFDGNAKVCVGTTIAGTLVSVGIKVFVMAAVGKAVLVDKTVLVGVKVAVGGRLVLVNVAVTVGGRLVLVGVKIGLAVAVAGEVGLAVP